MTKDSVVKLADISLISEMSSKKKFKSAGNREYASPEMLSYLDGKSNTPYSFKTDI